VNLTEFHTNVNSNYGYEGLRVLVTGGAGFIGANLTKKLVRLGAEVTVLDNLYSSDINNLVDVFESIDFVYGDIRDHQVVEAEVRDQDLIFHEAANASVPNSVKDTQYDLETNARGTLTILNAIVKTDSDAKVIYASSAAVYGEPPSVPVREDFPLSPISPYGITKLTGEHYGMTFYHNYGVPFISLRYFNVYGPLQRRYVMYDFLWKLSQSRGSRLEVLGDGNQARDFIFVSDAVEANLLLAMKPMAVGESFNVATGEPTTIKELVELTLEALGLQGKTRIVYTGKSWKGDVTNLYADITKLKKVGFKPKVGISRGLRTLLNWFKERHGSTFITSSCVTA